MVEKTFSDRELIELLGNSLSSSSFFRDKEGYLIGINFNLEKLLNEVNSKKINVIVSYIQEKLFFLKKYGFEIEEIIYLPHLSIPDTIYVSFLKPVNDNDVGEVLYAKK